MSSQTGTSVSLKFNTSSVMLYRNTYQPASPGQPGHTKTDYVASFSVRETSVPAGFDATLRELTGPNQARYQELIERMQARVFEPRKLQIAADQAAKIQAMGVAELDQAVHGLRSFESKLLAGAVRSDEETQTQVVVLTGLVAGLAYAMRVKPVQIQASVDAPTPTAETPEAKLLRLLEQLNQVNGDIENAARALVNGHECSIETRLEWQKTWFSHQAMFDKVKSRKGLVRPAGWSSDRCKGQSANGELIA